MPSRYTHRYLAVLALEAWDLCILVLALAAAFWSANPPLGDFLVSRSWNALLWLMVAPPLWHIALRATRLYDSHRLSTKKAEVLDAVKGVSLGTGLIAVPALALDLAIFGLLQVATIWLVATLIMVTSRMLMRLLLQKVRVRGRNLRHILIIGHGERAQNLIQKLSGRNDLGYRVLGCVDSIEHTSAIPAWVNCSAPLLGDLQSVSTILAENSVDEVFVTLPIKSHYEQIETIIDKCREQGIPVRLPLELFNVQPQELHIEMLEGSPVLSVASGWGRNWYPFLKRAIDLTGSLLLLLLLAPMFLVVAVLIKLDSSGPVFFVQKRVGRNKRPFNVFKFRTMREGSELMQDQLEHLNKAEGPVFKITDDPRTTGLGRFLRQTSIDELPQLINVLKGEMSLVGPRPLPLRDVKGFTLDWQRRRFSVLPGITCFWQVSGRSDTSFQEWMKMDMDYIDHASLWLDLKIISKTIPAVFMRRGAY